MPELPESPIEPIEPVEPTKLPSEFPADPIIGDGIVTVPGHTPKENEKMADQIDLPPNVASMLLAESTGNIQNTNLNGRNIANIAMGSLQAGVAKVHNEMGTEESRAISGVLATPVAGPTTQGS